MCLLSTDFTALAGHQFGAQGVFFSIVHLLLAASLMADCSRNGFILFALSGEFRT
jgi:hypothetical protein